MQQARRDYSAILAAAPVDAEFAPLVERRSGGCRPARRRSRRCARPTTGCAGRSRSAWCATARFASGAMSRLASLAGSTLAGSEAAFAALAALDLPRADLLERRSEELWSEPWAPFLTYKAKQQAARKEIAEARATLLPVHRAFRVRLAWRALAERLGAVGVVPGPPLARDAWEAADWWFDQGASRLDLLPARPAAAPRARVRRARARRARSSKCCGTAALLPPLAVPAGATAVRLALAGVERAPSARSPRALGRPPPRRPRAPRVALGEMSGFDPGATLR